MATHLHNPINFILVILISTSVLFMAVILKLSLPVMVDFAHSEIPFLWSFVIPWLKPPFLHVVFNCIIITIVALSRFLSNVAHNDGVVLRGGKVDYSVQDHYPEAYRGVVLPNEEEAQNPELENGYGARFVDVSDLDDVSGDADAIVSDQTSKIVGANKFGEMKGENEFAASKSSWIPVDGVITDADKPLVSSRFGHYRKSLKASNEGRRPLTLGVSKSKREDTLENTWKAITDGHSVPLTRHLNKSDTWETRARHSHHGHSCRPEGPQDHRHGMTKSETFDVDRCRGHNANVSALSPSLAPGSGKLRKDPSPGQDELNRKVEAFIRKFNEEMRLQRQESLNQFMEMISRGAH